MNRFCELARHGVSGLPVYEPGSPIEEVARELGFADATLIDKLASNENALGPSPMAVTAMREAASAMHRYPDGGTYYLREGIARHTGVTPNSVLPGNGSNELIELLGHAFLDKSTGIVMADGAFVVYKLVAAMFGADVQAVPMRDLTHDLPAMLSAIRPETRIVFISNPNNPTGTMVGQSEIDAFMDAVPEHVVVCFDEAYIELVQPARRPDVLRYVREGRQVIVLRTFSKAYGLAGLRIGYGIAPEPCVELLNHVRQPFNVNAMAQVAALAALEDADHVARTLQLLSDELGYLYGEFSGLGLGYVPSDANFVLVRVGRGRVVQEALKRAGTIVRPMDAYGLPEYVRVTVGTHDENTRFVRSLKECLGAAPAGNNR